MTDFNDSTKPTEPRRTAAISTGQFVSGSVFRLVREIRGSAYSVGDQFMLVESEDCHDPNTLILGGVGENYFIDPRGKPLKIEAGDAQIDSIFELVGEPQSEVVEEIGAEDAPIRHVTEEQFKTFREGLAGVLNEIAAVRSTGGERGERGPRGYTGVQGDKGDAGPQGPQGERGERGETGERGEKGDAGERGPQGERGEPGPQGDRGEQGERGPQGERGEKGEQGERGHRGEKGEQGEAGAEGPQGPRGERGADGAAGADGRDGAAGPRGERGEKGERGAEGKAGKAGAKGEKGDKGDRGEPGESGLVTAKFPLVYDAEEKSIAIDEERLDKILKRIMGGGKVSATDMGWLASTGGGGKVAVYINGSKITPDVRTLDFTGAGVTATKVGGKVTVNISSTGGSGVSGDYVYSLNGITGPVGLSAGVDVVITQSGKTLSISSPTVYGVSAEIYASNLSTGLLHGGTLAINGVCAAKFDISAGRGQIHYAGAGYTHDPQPTLTFVSWGAQTGVTLDYLATHPTTWLYYDSTGALHQQPSYYTDDQIENNIIIGALIHPTNSVITLARSIPNVAYATDKQYEQFIRSFGPIKVSGHTISANGANLKLNRSSGTAFVLGRNYAYDPNNPSVLSDGAKTDCSFYYYYRNGSGGFVTDITKTEINPTGWDDGSGTLPTAPNGKYTIQRLFFYPKTPDVLGVYYGRATYVSIAEAAANLNIEDFTEIENTKTNAIFVGYLIVKAGASSLQNTADALILQAGTFRSTTSGGGSVSIKLDDLTDVTISNIQDNDLIIYDSATQQWSNTPASHLSVTSYNGQTGAVQGVCAAVAGTGIFVSGSTGTVTITNTGVQSFNGLTGAVQGVSSWNGQTGAVQFHNYVSSFNGVTGAVQGVSAVNGRTGAISISVGQGITVSQTPDGISLAVNWQFGGETIPGFSAAGVDFMLLQRKGTGGSGAMFLHNIANLFQQFVPQYIPIVTRDEVGASPSYTFLMTGGGGDVETDIPSTASILSPYITKVDTFNGKTGPIGFVAQQGITLSVSGTTTSISLNYLQGASSMEGSKYPSKSDWIAIQKYTSPNLMQRTQIGNISYLFLGTQANKGSGSFFRMATDINGGEGTATDQYVSFSAIADEILNQIDGGTFA